MGNSSQWIVIFYVLAADIPHVFNGGSFDLDRILDLTKMRLAIWSKAKWPSIYESVVDIQRSRGLVRAAAAVNIQRKASSWSCPPEELLKFNVDGSALGQPGLAGIGGVLRDHGSNIKLVFSKHRGVADSNLAELLAIREAIFLFSSG
ncbi:hypothetical protein DITRI_Ditri01bG0015800 [Diplodiscus trichospermus]